ncbi:MAG TPA: fibronectin type III domain-containing protein [Thermoplasmata archaeon]|jgi:hypothetical protein
MKRKGSYATLVLVALVAVVFGLSAVHAAPTANLTGSSGLQPDAVPPAPTGLTATATNATVIHLAWTNPVGALTDNEYYEFAAAACSGGHSTVDIGSVVTSANVGSLSSATSYGFEVLAKNATGFSAPSTCHSGMTYPDVPTSLVANVASDTEIDLTWTNPSGTLTDTFVNVYVASTCTGSPTTLDMAGVVTAYADIDLAQTTTYSYTIAAADTTGTGAASACVSATTQATPGGGPPGGGSPPGGSGNSTNATGTPNYPTNGPALAFPAFTPAGLLVQNFLGIVSLIGGAVLFAFRRFILGPTFLGIGLVLLFVVF